MSTSRAPPRPQRITSRKAAAAKRTTDRPPVARGKLFANGRSQAVRLPKEFRLPGNEVLIHREGNRLILEPVDVKGWPIDLWEQIDELAAGFDDDWQRPADPVPLPIRRERNLP
jgi:antitoxin VapB